MASETIEVVRCFGEALPEGCLNDLAVQVWEEIWKFHDQGYLVKEEPMIWGFEENGHVCLRARAVMDTETGNRLIDRRPS